MWFVSPQQLPTRVDRMVAPRPPRPARSGSLRFAMDALIGAALMIAVHAFVIQVSIVRGDSMEPALKDGDRLVVDRVAYSLADVDRGDVIVLRYPRDPEIDFVKRVVAVPGDRVELRAGTLLVNGAAADNYGCIPDFASMAEVTVTPSQFFVLGDNRPISCDSREFGLVSQDLIKGRVRARFWPLDTAAIF